MTVECVYTSIIMRMEEESEKKNTRNSIKSERKQNCWQMCIENASFLEFNDTGNLFGHRHCFHNI